MHNLNFIFSIPTLSPELSSQVYFYMNVDPVPTINEAGEELSMWLWYSLFLMIYGIFILTHISVKHSQWKQGIRKSLLDDLSTSSLLPLQNVQYIILY